MPPGRAASPSTKYSMAGESGLMKKKRGGLFACFGGSSEMGSL